MDSICCCLDVEDCPPYVRGCLGSCQLAGLALLLASAVVLQVLACALYDNWWPMLTVIMYVLLPIPFMFFGGDSLSVLAMPESGDWVNLAKFLTGFSAVGSFAVPSILYHAGLINTAAMCMAFGSFLVLMLTIVLFSIMFKGDDDGQFLQ